MKIMNLGNGIFLNLENGETKEDFDSFHFEEWKEERRKIDRRILNLFSETEIRETERRKNDRRKPFNRIPTKEEILFFIRKDGYYIH